MSTWEKFTAAVSDHNYYIVAMIIWVALGDLVIGTLEFFFTKIAYKAFFTVCLVFGAVGYHLYTKTSPYSVDVFAWLPIPEGSFFWLSSLVGFYWLIGYFLVMPVVMGTLWVMSTTWRKLGESFEYAKVEIEIYDGSKQKNDEE